MPSEVYFLKQMKDHPNVIKFLHYQKLSTETFALICERPTPCEDMLDLQARRAGYFTEYESKRFIKTLVDVLLAMERKDIAHRDLKLENILYDFKKDRIKLIDFGLASKHKPGQLIHQFSGELTQYIISLRVRRP